MDTQIETNWTQYLDSPANPAEPIISDQEDQARQALEEYSNLLEQQAAIMREADEKIAELMPPVPSEIQEQIDIIRLVANQKANEIAERMKVCDKQIRDYVMSSNKTLRGSCYQAVYFKGRRSVDVNALLEFADKFISRLESLFGTLEKILPGGMVRFEHIRPTLEDIQNELRDLVHEGAPTMSYRAIKK